MQLWNGLQSITDLLPECVVAVGVFDGVHIGHQALILQAVAEAAERQLSSVVFTFDRHPMSLIAPSKAPVILTPPEKKYELIGALGVDHLVSAAFDDRFRNLSAEAFARFVLSGVLGARSVHVGVDFRFGCNQEGDVAYLADAGTRHAFDVRVLDAILVEGERVSSSLVRKRVAEGDVKSVHPLLGRSYSLSGRVVGGERVGRTLGFPTANLDLPPKVAIPVDGVYAVQAKLGDTKIAGACSIGTRPTFQGDKLAVETYLLDFSDDLYGQMMEVEFVDRVRGQEKFESVDALVVQMNQDIEQVKLRLNL
jgi:riboflavin kinase/FMN adenylyltransferase